MAAAFNCKLLFTKTWGITPGKHPHAPGDNILDYSIIHSWITNRLLHEGKVLFFFFLFKSRCFVGSSACSEGDIRPEGMSKLVDEHVAFATSHWADFHKCEHSTKFISKRSKGRTWGDKGSYYDKHSFIFFTCLIALLSQVELIITVMCLLTFMF